MSSIKENNIAVIISGTGRTLKNLIEKSKKGLLLANIAIVISSKKDVLGIKIAREAGIETVVIDRRNFDDDRSFSEQITKTIDEQSKKLVLSGQGPIRLIVMAGFLHKYLIPKKYRLKVMNIHPALIPSFCGKKFYGERVHQAVWKRGVKVTGCTVHFADNMYDHGPIILQKAVPVFDDDTPESIAQRVFKVECKLYPRAINLFFKGKLSVRNGRVFIKE